MRSARASSCSLLLASFAALACGPDQGEDTGAATSTTDGEGSGGTASTSVDTSASTSGSASASTSGTGTAGSASTTADSSGTADGGSGEETGGACPPSLVPVEPGCEPAPDGLPIPASGCYVPCEAPGTPCDQGTCQTVWHNPCVCPDGEGCCGACGGETTICMPAGATGDECESDSDCASGICWNFSDYDPCCFGTACSDVCRTDADCIALAQEAGAAMPEDATCGADNRCDLVGTGLGSWACAGPPCG
jgi:hypothetical protein